MAKISNKMKNTRVVTFKDDYKIEGRAKPVYRKGETHYIHHLTVEALKEAGAKMEVKKYQAEEKIEAAREKVEKTKKD